MSARTAKSSGAAKSRGVAGSRGAAPLVLVDPPAGSFWPLAATRPVAELLSGTRSFRDRWTARAGPVAAVVCEPAVAAGGNDPPWNAWPDSAGGYRVALSSWAPPAGLDFGAEAAELLADGEPVGWRLTAGQARAIGEAADPAAVRSALSALALPAREAGGRRVDSVWSLMAAIPDLVADDAADFPGADSVRGVDPFVLMGDPSALRVGAGVAIGPFVVLDAEPGPVVLDEGARVEPHALLRGPLYVGRGSVVLGGSVSGSAIGPGCRVRGEVEQTIFQGHANKAHDGFVGHSVLGEWVNLGAGTITSDLKNTYGPVRLEDPDGAIETGLLKVGAFLGDHARTGIGTLLTTGTRVGVGSHVFGGGLAPSWLPDFSWHDGRERTDVRWEPFLRTAEIMMARRDRAMEGGRRRMLAALHAATAGGGGEG